MFDQPGAYGAALALAVLALLTLVAMTGLRRREDH
jgi:hypothetical protein